MLAWFAPTSKPIHVLLSKADKLTREEQARSLGQVQAALTDLGGNCSAQLFSSLKKTGIPEAELVLAGWLGVVAKAESPPTASATAKTARPKKRSAIGWGARNAASASRRQ